MSTISGTEWKAAAGFEDFIKEREFKYLDDTRSSRIDI